MTRNFIPALAIAIAMCLGITNSNAQFEVDWIGTTGNWTETAKWSTGNFPSVDFEEQARIDGGDVTVNTALADGVDGGGNSTNPGQLLIGGNVLVGPSVSTLTIANGGSLHVQAGIARNGFFDIGFGPGTGTVKVLPGGSLEVDGFFSTAFNPLNVMEFGATSGAGTATINAGMSLLAGTTIIHANADFNVANQVETGATTVFRPVYSAGNVAKVDIGGPLRLFGGTLRPDAGGAALPVNTPKTLFEADLIVGDFDEVDTSLLGPAGPGQAYVTNVVEAGGDREALQFSLRQMAVLNVNRDTGATSITNLGASGVTIDGYSIASSAGALATASWTSLDDTSALGGDWQESPGTATRLSELKEGGVGTINNGANLALGNIFAAGAGDFGVDTEDLQFNYTTTDGSFTGIVNYTGTKVNTLLLEVDPVSGQARLRNTSEDTVAIDGYTISSASGLSLDPVNWNSLDEQNAAGGDWQASPGTAGRLSELKEGTETSLAPGALFDLGALFNEAEEQDLSFQFVLHGDEEFEPIDGRVLYGSLSAGVSGDYNNNGTVDAADYTVWRDNLGTSATLPNDTTPGNVSAADYTVWKTNFGLTGGAGAGAGALTSAPVPEPGTAVLLLIAFVTAFVFRRSTTAIACIVER